MRIALAAVLLLALAACQSPTPVAEPAAPPVEEPEPLLSAPVEPPPAPIANPTASEHALAAGIALYDAGNFNGAIKQLRGAREIWSDSTSPGATANKLAARKYLAFSYCVTNRHALCRQQFVDAIKLEPGFHLAPAEKGHPIWGPEFDRARKQASAPVAPAERPAQSAATPSRRSP